MKPLLFAIGLVTALVAAIPVTIDNTKPRLDTNGNIVDGHDGVIRRVENVDGFTGYILFTLSYGDCKEPAKMGCDSTPDHCGFQLTQNISVWKTETLSSGSWEYVGLAILPSERLPGTIFRPDAIFNPNTGLWVLWWVSACVGRKSEAQPGRRWQY
jgi:hypothetical protein